VEVPDVVGETQTRALLELDNRRLEGAVSFAHSPDVRRGIVISQDPPAGGEVSRGGTVALVVSRGAGLVVMPEVEGVPLADAEAALTPLELVIEVTEVNHEDIPAGVVIRQAPTPTTTARTGDDVQLVVSAGPAIRVVPPLLGLPLEGAAFNLGRSGLLVGVVSYETHGEIPKGGVISTTPAEGAQLPRDSTVDVLISEGTPAEAVPDVVGLTQEEASGVLGEAGYIVAVRIQGGDPADPNVGNVVHQDPAAGAGQETGNVVTLTVLRGRSGSR